MCFDCLLVRKDLHEIFSLFCNGCGVLLRSSFSNFSWKKHRAAIYFPLLFYCKTNASALEFLTEIIGPSSRIFFLNPLKF